MAFNSIAEKIIRGKTPRSPRVLVEDCIVICVSMPGICERFGIVKTATMLREMVFRHWFQCPLCKARCFKLYLPPGVKVFGCRKCHRLTYASSLKRNPDGSPRKAKPKPLVPAQEESATNSLWMVSENTKWLPRPDPPAIPPELAKWLPRPPRAG